MKKRGMVSPVFKYIMALLVGVVFLIFLINFALKYAESKGGEEAYKLITGFDDVLSALGSSEDSDNTYNFGVMTDLRFEAGDDPKRDTFRMWSKTKKWNTYKVIFAPRDMKGTSMHILTKRWYFPYAVDNFFYMTNKNYKYFLISDTNTEELVNELAGPEEEVTAEIPRKFGVEVLDAGKVASNMNTIKKSIAGFKRVNFILFEENPSVETALSKLSNANVRIIKPNDDDPDYGEILFEDGQNHIYLGRTMMIGAIFTEDSETYDFAVAKALEKLGIITNIYMKKIEIMGPKYTRYLECSNKYNSMYEKFGTISDLAKDDSRETDQYKTYVEALEENNLQLGGDCPEIF